VISFYQFLRFAQSAAQSGSLSQLQLPQYAAPLTNLAVSLCSLSQLQLPQYAAPLSNLAVRLSEAVS
jgi:hypothetical protein